MNRINKGFSLIELLLVLGVLALLMAALFILYPSVNASITARQASTGIQASLARVRAAAGPVKDYAWLTPSVSHRFFPSSWVFPNGANPPAIRPPSRNGRANFWLSGSTATGATTGAGRNSLRLEVYSLAGNASNPPDEDYCIKFISDLAPTFSLVYSDGGITILDKENPNAVQRKATVDVAAVAAACTKSSSSSSPIVYFVGR